MDSAHILVVDDDQSSRELLARILTSAGHRVTPLSDGREAVAALDAGDPPRPGGLRHPHGRDGRAPGHRRLPGTRARHAGHPGHRLRQHRRRGRGHPPRRDRLPLQALRRRRDPDRGGPGAPAPGARHGEPGPAPRAARPVPARQRGGAQRGHAAGLQDRRPGRLHRRHGAHPGGERHREGARGPGHPHRLATRRGPLRGRGLRRHRRGGARVGALRPRARAPSPAPRSRAAASSRRPTAAPSSSTRSATSAPTSRPGSCGPCRRAPSGGWAPTSPSPWTCGSSPPPTGTWRRR